MTVKPYPDVVLAREDISPNTQLLDVLILMARNRRVIYWCVGVAALISAAVSLLIPATFTARTKLLPPPNNQSMASMLLSQVAGAAPLLGSMVNGKDIKTGSGNDTYVAILQSRAVGEPLIKKFGLQQVYRKKNMTDTLAALQDHTTITNGKDGVLTIDVEDHDPARAADIANGYSAELEVVGQSLAVSEAARRRLFFEREMNKAKVDLAAAEDAMRAVQEKTGIVEPTAQSKAMIELFATVHAQITAKEVQREAMRSFATEENPELRRINNEIAALRGQLAELEQKTGSPEGGMEVSVGRVPKSGMEYIRRFRDVKYHEAVYEAMAKQLALAKLDEGKEAALLQVLDPAVPPERRTRPQRSLIVLASVVLGFLCSIGLVLLLEFVRGLRGDPRYEERVNTLFLTLRAPK